MSTAWLEAENERLRCMVAELKAALAPAYPLPEGWNLTKTEEKIVRLCIARERATYGAILALLYTGKKPRNHNISSVFVNKIRKKLRPFGIELESIAGRCLSLPASVRADVAKNWPVAA